MLNPRSSSRILLACGLWLAACGLPACSRPRPPGAWRQREFLIALRGAPPAKPRYYAHVAAAGFNAIAEGAGPEALDLARRYRLRVILDRIGLDPRTLGDRASRENVARTLDRFKSHPALWGYFVGDEMLDGQLADVAALARFARRHDPAHPLLLTLLPCDAWVGPALATADYAAYIERCIRAARPAFLCYAHFPFRQKRDSAFAFENLELIRRAALRHGLPFFPTLQAVGWPGMRPPTQGELRWLVYTALAYGAKGVVWFRYWGGRAPGGQALVEPDGLLAERHRWVAALNADLRALGPVLLRLRSVAVYHTAPTPVGAARLPVHGLVGSVAGGAFVVGEFEDAAGAKHLLVVNRDAAWAATVKLTINRPCRRLAWFDPAAGAWADQPATTDRFQSVAEFALPPGGGRLLRLGEGGE